jgi:hypothetical protein
MKGKKIAIFKYRYREGRFFMKELSDELEVKILPGHT